MIGTMAAWNDVTTASPELAALVRARIEATGLALLATLRHDGSPRISGIEPSFFGDHLWIGMMDGSRKGRDLQRDPRFALHNATVDKTVAEGDVKISGRAIEVLDDAEKAEFLRLFETANGYAPPPGPMQLFTADITEVVTVKPDGDHLDIDTWIEGRGTSHLERR